MNELMVDLLNNSEDIFRKHSVAFAYLFGSGATGKTHTRSDIDIAVFFSSSTQPSEYLNLQLSLIMSLKSHLKREVDVVVLNNRHDELVQSVFSHGQLIFDSEPETRKTFRHRFSMMYFDFLPYRQRYITSVIQRLKQQTELHERTRRHQESIQKIRRMSRTSPTYPR